MVVNTRAQEPMEIEIGKEALKKSTEYVSARIDGVGLSSLRTYFAVDDAFVLRKLCLVLFPFNNTDWTQNEELTRPELYIPAMSLVSYILLKALRYGLDGTFSPERLGLAFTHAVLLELLCAGAVKVSGYFGDVSLGTLDVMALCGYKYVCVVVVQAMWMWYARVVVGLYVHVSLFFFLSRSLKKQVIGDGTNRRKRVYYLFGVVALQVCIAFLLC